MLVVGQTFAASAPVDFATASKNVVQGPYIPGKQKEHVAIYQDGSKRYAVIDATGTTEPVKIDGSAFNQYGLSSVRISKRVNYPKPAKGAASKPSALSGPKKDNPENAVEPTGIGATTYWLRWWEPWFKEYDLSNDTNLDTRVGAPKTGCRNRNVPPFPCTLTQEAKAKVAANSRLTINQLIELGFEVGFEFTETVAAEVQAEPGYHYRLEPRVIWYREFWQEKREQYKCEVEYSWQWWCDSDPIKIGEQTRSGTARRPDEFYGDVSQQSN